MSHLLQMPMWKIFKKCSNLNGFLTQTFPATNAAIFKKCDDHSFLYSILTCEILKIVSFLGTFWLFVTQLYSRHWDSSPVTLFRKKYVFTSAVVTTVFLTNKDTLFFLIKDNALWHKEYTRLSLLDLYYVFKCFATIFNDK